MDVGVEREARRVMTEPLLNLNDVPPLSKQPARDGMPERVEPCPLGARFGACRSKHAFGQVVRIEDGSGLALEDEVAGPTRPQMGAQALGQLDRDRQVTSGVP